MAATGHFQLFPPPPPPPPKTNRDSNPFRKNGVTRISTAPTTTSTIIEETANDSPETRKSGDGVEIKVFKEMSPIQEPPEAHMQPMRTDTPPLVKTEQVQSTTFPRRNISLSKRPTRIDTGKGRAAPLPRLQETISPKRKSPVVAMRSMFPRYNPSVPLTGQSYYPQGVQSSQVVPERSVPQNEISPSAASVSRIDEIVGGPKTAPASVLNFPIDVLDVEPARISNVQELRSLWEAANGQGPEWATESFNLKLSRIEEARFTFGSAATLPFYTLETYSTNELVVSRTHPLNSRFSLPILQLRLEAPSTSNSPESNHNASTTNLLARKSPRPRSREMITYIFPELAAMLAMDQAETLAEQHRVAPTVKTQMSSEAVARAAAQEASRLYWNENECRYELEHPAIGKDQPKSPTALVISDEGSSAHQQQPYDNVPRRPVLHITITTPEADRQSSANPADSVAYPTIAITDPNQYSVPKHPVSNASAEGTPPLPSPRASTTPVPDATNDTLPAPLASLTFAPSGSGPHLSIDTAQITRLLPSLYAIDSLVAALLAVAVADSSTNPMLADMELYDPVSEYRKHIPRMPSTHSHSHSHSHHHAASSVGGASTIGGKSYTGTRLYATLAEREEAEQESRMMRQLQRKNEGRSKAPRKSFSGMSAFHFREADSHSHTHNNNDDIDLEEADHDDDDDEDADAYYLDEKGDVCASSRSTKKPLSWRKKNKNNKKKRRRRNRGRRVTIQEFDLEKYTTYQSGSRQGEKLPGITRTVVAVLFWGFKVFVALLSLAVEVLAKVLVLGSRAVTSERF